MFLISDVFGFTLFCLVMFIFLVLIIAASILRFVTGLYWEKPVCLCFLQSHRLQESLLKSINSNLCRCRTPHINTLILSALKILNVLDCVSWKENCLSVMDLLLSFDSEQKAQPLWMSLNLHQNRFGINNCVQESLRIMVLTWRKTKNAVQKTFYRDVLLHCFISTHFLSVVSQLYLWW